MYDIEVEIETEMTDGTIVKRMVMDERDKNASDAAKVIQAVISIIGAVKR